MLTTQPLAATHLRDPGLRALDGAVTGTPRTWLRIEGLAALGAGVVLYLHGGGQLVWLLPLLLVPDLSMAGYLGGPRMGALSYNLVHTWAAGIAVLAVGFASGAAPVIIAGGVLVAHTGMDRVAGYGIKYPSAFGDTHLGRIGRPAR